MLVTLAKSVRLPGDRLRRVGEVVEVDDEVFASFSQLGVFAAPAPEPAAPAKRVEVEPVAEPEAPAAVKRPRKTAPLDAWKAYAESKGIDPKGMTKAELIAAVG